MKRHFSLKLFIKKIFIAMALVSQIAASSGFIDTSPQNRSTVKANGKELSTPIGNISRTIRGNSLPGKVTFVATNSMNVPRQFHTATLLNNGKVLVVGGYNTIFLASAELYDPAAGTWTVNGAMSFGRAGHTATLLDNGKVLIAGGIASNVISELYDPATGTWTTTGNMSIPRMFHTATKLTNGKVLVAGGGILGSEVYSSAEIYDPGTGLWTSAGTMSAEREFHTATLLNNGNVLVAGGQSINNSKLASAEVYDPLAATWTLTGDMLSAVGIHKAVLLNSGDVLVAGGEVQSGLSSTSQVYDVGAGVWSSSGLMSDARAGHEMTKLPNGIVLITGSGGLIDQLVISKTELFDESTSVWVPADNMTQVRGLHTATLLNNGKVLIAGGTSDGSNSLSSTEIASWSLGTYYVKPTSSGTGDCSSWDNACGLQTALSSSLSGEEIWVSSGTYKPTTGSDRNISFNLKEGVSLFGGFAGVETSREERYPQLNQTILSGDLLGNDNDIIDYREPTRAENSYHVVVGADNAVMDGFIVVNGNASGFGGLLNRGGGMFNNAVSPILENIIFRNNSAVEGGGMWNNSNNPTLTNIQFEGNFAYSGGGVENTITSGLGNSSPVFNRVLFNNNVADYGGGMSNYLNANPTLVDVSFNDNTSTEGGGGLYNYISNPQLTNVTFVGNGSKSGGGMLNYSANPVLVNVTFSENSALYGGGINNSSGSDLLATNVTFTGNTASNLGGAISNYDTSTQYLENVIIWNNSAPNGSQIFSNSSGASIVKSSILQGGCQLIPVSLNCSSVRTVDPLLGILGSYGGFTQVIPLLPYSPAFNTGNDLACSQTDQRGVSRPQGSHCDLGAYEFEDFAAPETTLLTKPASNIRTTTAVFTFSGDDADGSGVASFKCQLNGGTYVTCTSPYTTPTLANGIHSLNVYSIDLFNNADPSPASYSWRVDTIAPDTSINSKPPAVDTDNTPSFSFGGTDGTGSGVNSYMCKLDNGTYEACVSPYTFSALADGSHTFYVYSIDLAGNADASPASYSWQLDATAPSTTLVGKPPLLDSDITPTFTFSGSDSGGSGIASYKCKMDGGLYATCSSPITSAALSEGSHDFLVYAVDAFGNSDLTPAAYTWTIDSTAPDTTITGTPPNFDKDITPTFTFSGTDGSGSGVSHFMCRIDNGAYSLCVSPYTFDALLDNSHVFDVYAVDLAGNSDALPATYSWTIDTTPPQVKSVIRSGTESATGSTAQFVVSFSEAVLGIHMVSPFSDFSLLTSPGITGAFITGVSGFGDTYTVTINTGAGNGTIQLGLPASATVADLAGNFMTSIPFENGEKYMVRKTPAVRYVKTISAGYRDCSIWENACDLQTALNTSISGDEIWVVSGTYKPTSALDRSVSFVLKSGVGVYGGFSGVETLRSQRDFAANITLLSGEIGSAGISDNSYHVVTGTSITSTAVLDGFTITKGNGDALVGINSSGGGLYLSNASPTLSNLIILANSARTGGGIAVSYGSPLLGNISIISNSAGSGGGALIENASPIFKISLIYGNFATTDGGGVTSSNSLSTFESVTFNGNIAGSYGGGIYNNYSDSIFLNVTMSENTSPIAGALFNGNSNPVIQNSILWGNSNGEMVNILGSAPDVSYSIVSGGFAGIGNSTQDPFLGILADNGGYTQTMALSTGSPAIDSGNDAVCAATDQRGVTRPKSGHCDMGAYELDLAPEVVSITRASTSPTSSASVVFTVTFSEPVTGLNNSAPFSALALTSMGLSGASITSISGSGSIYTVTVNTGNGVGVLRLDVVDDNSILDTDGNFLGGVLAGDGSFTSGESYSIKRVPPDVVTNTWAVKLSPFANPDTVAAQLGGQNLGQIGQLPAHYLFRFVNSEINPQPTIVLLAANSNVLWFSQQVARSQSKRGEIASDQVTALVSENLPLVDLLPSETGKNDVSLELSPEENSKVNALMTKPQTLAETLTEKDIDISHEVAQSDFHRFFNKSLQGLGSYQPGVEDFGVKPEIQSEFGQAFFMPIGYTGDHIRNSAPLKKGGVDLVIIIISLFVVITFVTRRSLR